MMRWRNKADLSSRHCGWIMIALLCGEAHEKIDRFKYLDDVANLIVL